MLSLIKGDLHRERKVTHGPMMIGLFIESHKSWGGEFSEVLLRAKRAGEHEVDWPKWEFAIASGFCVGEEGLGGRIAYYCKSGVLTPGKAPSAIIGLQRLFDRGPFNLLFTRIRSATMSFLLHLSSFIFFFDAPQSACLIQSLREN